MKRNIAKAVEDYKRKQNSKTSRAGDFYYSDVCQVRELAEENAHPAGGGGDILYNAIIIALEAGYSIGYRTAKRHQANKNSATIPEEA